MNGTKFACEMKQTIAATKPATSTVEERAAAKARTDAAWAQILASAQGR